MAISCIFKKYLFFPMLLLAWSRIVFSQTDVPVTTPVTKHIGGYWEHLPAGYASSTTKYPLLIFFHGIDEVGDGSQRSLPKVQKNAVPKLIKQNKFPESFTVEGKTFSFIVICPQLSVIGRSADEIDDLISYMVRKYRVDESRIYLTGISLGGGTCLFYAGGEAQYARRVAAIVTASQNLSVSESKGKNVASSNLPLWMTHNMYDNKIPVRNTTGWDDFLDNYKPSMKPKPLMNLFDAFGHDAWSVTFNPNWRPNGLNVYEWMLQYSRDDQPPASQVHAVINAPDTTVFTKKNSIQLDGSSSTSDDYSTLNYKWECTSGPPGFSIQNTNAAKTSLTVASPGTYTITLTVSNNGGASASQTKTIVVVKGKPPVAVITNDSVLVLPKNYIVLDASGSYDSDGKITGYQWFDISGPSGFVASNRWRSSLSLQNLSVGSYSFGVVVSNKDGITDTAITKFVVKDAAMRKRPVAVITNDSVVIAPKNYIALDASHSYDSSGKITGYQWTYISGPLGFDFDSRWRSSLNLKNLSVGSYRFSVIVTNNAGLKDTAITSFVVKKAPETKKPPVAIIKNDAVVVLPKDSIVLDASASYDNDGKITHYEWRYVYGPSNFIMGNNAQPVITIKNLSAGNYRFGIIITSDAGLKDTAITNFVVKPAPIVKKPPVAIIKNDAVVVLPKDSIMLNATSSYDSTGTITRYEWRYVSGPAGSLVVNGAQPITVIRKLKIGSYQFGVIVTNNVGMRDTAITSFVVKDAPIAKKPPVAIIKNDGVVVLPKDSIVLNASFSYDSTSTITNYYWGYVLGPAGSVIINSSQSVATIKKVSAGYYRFGVIVTNAAGLKDTAFTSFIVKKAPEAKKPPVAIIKNDPEVDLPKDSIVLNAGSSYDSSGRNLQYDWRYVFGPGRIVLSDTRLPALSIKNLSVGSYRFGVIVTNDAGLKDTAITNFIVKNGSKSNKYPIVVIKADSVITLPDSSITLDGSSSYDVDGIVASYQWQYVSGPSGFTIENEDTSVLAINKLSPGQYIFKLTITDNNDAAAFLYDTFVVKKSVSRDKSPVAIIRADKQIVLPENSITLNGTSSYDPDGSIKTYKWQYLSGPAGYQIAQTNQASVSISQLVAGKYSFMLIVTDNKNKADTAIWSFDVKSAVIKKPPIAIIKAPSVIYLPDNSIQLDGGSSYDADGAIQSYSWAYQFGPGGYVVSGGSNSLLVIKHLAEGSYSFKLTVTDNAGLTADTSIQFQVKKQVLNAAPIAIIKGDSVYTLPVDQIVLNGTSSYDPDGNIEAYKWRLIKAPQGVALQNNTSSNVRLEEIAVGHYKIELEVTDSKNHSDTTQFSFTVQASLQLPENAVVLTLAPVPAVSTMKVMMANDEKGKLTLRITDFNGKIVLLTKYDKPARDWQQQLDVANLPGGVYHLDVYVGKVHLTRRFIKGGK